MMRPMSLDDTSVYKILRGLLVYATHMARDHREWFEWLLADLPKGPEPTRPIWVTSDQINVDVLLSVLHDGPLEERTKVLQDALTRAELSYASLTEVAKARRLRVERLLELAEAGLAQAKEHFSAIDSLSDSNDCACGFIAKEAERGVKSADNLLKKIHDLPPMDEPR